MNRRVVALLALATLPPLIELAILIGLGFNAAQGLAPQVTAVWPYDSFHDLRWLLVYHNSWLTFFGGLVAVTVFRGVLSAGLVALAWPPGAARPTFGALVGRNLAVAALAMAVISPWAAFAVAASVVALSWYLFASLIPLLLLSPFLMRIAATGGGWRGLPSIELVGWSLLNFLVITVAGGLVWQVAGWIALLVALPAGVANGLLWQRTVRGAVLPRHRRLARLPVAPAVIALALVAPLGFRATAVALPGVEGPWRPPLLTQPLPDGVTKAVIAIAGYNSSYGGEPTADPRVEQYSYRGLDAAGRPQPYEPVDTHQSLERSAEVLATQVSALHRKTGRAVALVGASQGALVARMYLDKTPNSPVDTLLMFSPLIRSGRIYYPPPDADGWGLAAGWLLRVIYTVLNVGYHTHDSPDAPFVRSLLEDAPFFRNSMMCPVPGVRAIAFLPTVTAAEAPPGEYSRIPVYQVPAFHGGLLGRALVDDRTINFLAGAMIDQPRREYTLLQRLAAAWHAPPLAVSINPVWRDDAEPDPAFSGRICVGR